ncbi:MAG: GGDEF domain-containing protein [Clostridia bacterium]|nr:GGDEF domain-containing protein [Clostridia bacterium]
MERYDYPGSIMLFDIDFFKRINDTHGHDAGDHALKQLAQLVSQNVRKSDIFARWGGEEFIILLSHTALTQAEQIAEKIRALVENSSLGYLKDMTISIGLSEITSTQGALVQIIDEADAAMYQAKNKGRNRVCVFQPESN